MFCKIMKAKRNLIQIWLLCAAMLPAVAQAQFNYTDNGDGTCTIIGYTGPGGDVTIPSMINGLPVTSIGHQVFRYRSSLTSVTIPDSVTSIGDDAFVGCTSLTSVTIPNSVTNIGDGAFGGCTSLTSVTIPDSVTSIGYWAFDSCTSLTSVTIPDSVTNIGDGAFWGCYSLTSIKVDGLNSVYSSVDGVLFDKNQTTLI